MFTGFWVYVQYCLVRCDAIFSIMNGSASNHFSTTLINLYLNNVLNVNDEVAMRELCGQNGHIENWMEAILGWNCLSESARWIERSLDFSLDHSDWIPSGVSYFIHCLGHFCVQAYYLILCSLYFMLRFDFGLSGLKQSFCQQIDPFFSEQKAVNFFLLIW